MPYALAKIVHAGRGTIGDNIGNNAFFCCVGDCRLDVIVEKICARVYCFTASETALFSLIPNEEFNPSSSMIMIV